MKNIIEQFPKRIIGNDGYEAVFLELQPLVDGKFAGIYKYPGGEVVHFLEYMDKYEIIER